MATPTWSGEVHFWRLDPAVWPQVLESVRSLGLRVISTYLSWRSHAPDGPRADLTGATNPRLNLVSFLQLCQAMDLEVILKPGPWICAEEINGGYPDWLLEDPDLLMWDAAGAPLLAGDVPQQHRVPCYLHPTYLNWVKDWFTQVAAVIRPFSRAKGPVRVLQLDNEPSAAFHMGMWEMDYNPLIARPGGVYTRWLQARYTTLASLQEAHGRNYAAFSKAAPPRSLQKDTAPLRAALDWVDFKTWYFAEHLRLLKSFWCDLGLDAVQFSVNTIEGTPLGIPNDWRTFAKVSDLAGLDYYAYLPFTESDLCRVVQGVNYSRAVFGRVWAPELMSGTWLLEGDPPEPVNGEDCSRHTHLLHLTALAAGLERANFYMLVNRDHWDHAPIDGQGNPAVGYGRLAELMTLLQALPDMMDLLPVHNLAVLYDRHLARLFYLDPEDASLAQGYRRFQALYRDLVALGHYPALIDSEVNLAEMAKEPLLCVPGFRVCSRSVIETLEGFLSAGGRILFYGQPPGEDAQGQALATLEGAGVSVCSPNRDALESRLHSLGVKRKWWTDTSGVHIFYRRSASLEVLFLINLNPSPTTARLVRADGKSIRLAFLGPSDLGELAGQGELTFQLPELSCQVGLVKQVSDL